MQFSRYWNHELLNDPTYNKKFHDDGYVKIPFLAPEECASLYEDISRYIENNSALFHSRIHSTPESSKHIHETIIDFVMKKYDRLGITMPYKIVGAVFVSKAPSNQTEFGIHTDDSLCDERKYLPFNLWIPLADVDANNGTLNLYAGTHLKTSIFRGATIKDSFIRKVNSGSGFKPEPIVIKKGTAVFYHPGCIHFSGNNNSNSQRPAIVVSFIPADAEVSVFLEKRTFFFKRKIYKYNIERNDFDFYSWNNRTFPDFEPTEILAI